MDPLFWILAGVVVVCVVGILFIWRLEVRAERRAADTRRVEAEVSARLKLFDPRVAVEAVDTRPIQATPPPVAQAALQPAPRETPAAWEPEPSPPPEPVTPLRWAEDIPPPEPVAQPNWVEQMQPAEPISPPHWAEEVQPPEPIALPRWAEEREPEEVVFQAAEAHPVVEPEIPLPPPPEPVFVEEQEVAVYEEIDTTYGDEPSMTPELARMRASELSRERRYLEQAIAEEQDRLAQLLHIQTAVGSPESAPIKQLQGELAQQRQRLEEITLLEERYRQAAVPSLERMAQDYKNAASPHTPRAFGVRRHSLAPVDQPGKNPPAPPAQATTDSSS